MLNLKYLLNLNGGEWVLIILVAVLLFGSQAPKLVGKFFNTTKQIKEEVAKGMNEMKDTKDKEQSNKPS